MSDLQELGCGIAVIVAILAAAVAIGLVGASWKCSAKFEDASLPYRWSIIGGCQVKDPKAGWIPAENYRVL